jgi:site-specific recombinase XerD
MEDRQTTTVATYTTHVKTFCRWLAENHSSVALCDVSKLQVRAFLLHEANRGLAPVTRSTALFALRSFYRFLIAEDISEQNPAASVTVPTPNRPRVEFYSDAEADAIVEWASAQSGLRWQVGRVMLLTLRYTGLRLSELVNLSIKEVDLEARRISLVGKGRKPRVVPIPHLLAGVLGEYLEQVRPRLPASPYFFVNPRATGGCVVATVPGRFTAWCWRPGLRRAWPDGTSPTAGVTAMPRASCAGARTSTSSSA